jgi:hypothetical protein
VPNGVIRGALILSRPYGRSQLKARTAATALSAKPTPISMRIQIGFVTAFTLLTVSHGRGLRLRWFGDRDARSGLSISCAGRGCRATAK